MNGNNSTQVCLKAWKTTIDTMEVVIDVDGREYCEVLTALFNNKRENRKDIIDLYNNWGSNKITLVINLTHYGDGDADMKDTIRHILDWIESICNYNSKVEYTLGKAYLYEVDEYQSKIEYFDKEDNFYFNYVVLEP